MRATKQLCSLPLSLILRAKGFKSPKGGCLGFGCKYSPLQPLGKEVEGAAAAETYLLFLKKYHSTTAANSTTNTTANKEREIFKPLGSCLYLAAELISCHGTLTKIMTFEEVEGQQLNMDKQQKRENSIICRNGISLCGVQRNSAPRML